jgi:hypothetical protein
VQLTKLNLSGNKADLTPVKNLIDQIKNKGGKVIT